MDEIIKQNQVKWDELSRRKSPYSRPRLDLTMAKAKTWLHKEAYRWDTLKGKKILCLASGGGQQSIGFALLGAKVTVVDFSIEQLNKDKLAAGKFDKSLRLIQSDMQDLSMLDNAEFDLIFQSYSINFIPKVDKVFNEVARILKPNGIYDLMFHNPFVHGSWKDSNEGSRWAISELWRGKGYPLWQPYKDGSPVKTEDANWNFSNNKQEVISMKGPQGFRHTLSTIVNSLIYREFEILNIREEVADNVDDHLPGSWEHYKSIAPPWLYLITKKK